LSDYLPHLDTKALFTARWGLRPAVGEDRSTAEVIEAEGRPRLRALLDKVRAEKLARARVAFGFFPAWSDGNDLVITRTVDGSPRHAQSLRQNEVRLTFPRQDRPPHLAIPDYFAAARDVIGLQVVTMGPAFTGAANDLYRAGRYRDYLELHGLGAGLTEALADYWHGRMRAMLGIGGGKRYSFGYPACPDLAGRRAIVELVGAAGIGVELTETDLLVPETSTDAMIVHHPAATYFSVRGRGSQPVSGGDE
jgi:5-methyltetrahydrofolate--homocysteine methyltransferase